MEVPRHRCRAAEGRALTAGAGSFERTVRSRLVRELGAEHLPIITDAVERALVPLAASDGHVSLSGSTWIVPATNPA
jgi:hypothetical protein